MKAKLATLICTHSAQSFFCTERCPEAHQVHFSGWGGTAEVSQRHVHDQLHSGPARPTAPHLSELSLCDMLRISRKVKCGSIFILPAVPLLLRPFGVSVFFFKPAPWWRRDMGTWS